VRTFRSFQEFNQELQSIPSKLNSILLSLGNKAIALIRTRTTSGYGVESNGKTQKFAPLAQSTQKKKGKTESNLTDTGRMLGDMKASVRNQSCIVSFKSFAQLKKAEYHMSGTSTMPSRPFFLLSVKDLEAVSSLLESQLDEFIRNRF